MNITAGLDTFFEWLLNRSWQAGVLVPCVLLVQWLFRRQLTNRWRFALWWIVLARMVLPFGLESNLSLFNCFRPLQARVVVSAEAPAPTPMPAPGGATPDHRNLAPTLEPLHEADATRYSSTEFERLKNPGFETPATARPMSELVGLSAKFFSAAAACWLAGAIFLAASVLTQVFRFCRRLAQSATVADARLCAILAECRQELHLRRRVQLLETDAVKSPALFGLFHLRLLLPRGLAAAFDCEELRYIFLHELAHVRRGDLWLNWLVTALQILHWFNPLVWLGFARLRADRELACDELALRHAGETAAAAYGSTIIKLLEGLQSRASMPGLVGILEDKDQMRRRISRIAGFKKASRWSALAILLLGGLAMVALTDAQPEGVARPDLKGTIETQDGHPVQGTVFIYTAGPKVGTSTFCPSCYPDCEKSAKADAAGDFKISSLDPRLVFRILAAAPGYKPKFVSKVDPAKGPVEIRLAPIELATAPACNSLHGRVVDTNGAPIAGAVVEANGIREFNGGGRWGELQGVDPLAVTDRKGDFVITSIKPFDMMDVRASARGYANRTFTKLASGNEVHTLTLTTGAAIEGRVLFHGKPLAHVEMSIASADRTMDASTAYMDIGTDLDGRFVVYNLPPDSSYSVSGTMNSLAPIGVITVRPAQTGNDGSVTDLGDLIVTPGYRMSGRVLLADGKPLPPKTRLLISRDSAWDSIQVALPPDGRFDVSNVPCETYSLSVRVPGYYLSPKNASYDTLNPGRLVGRVDGDTTHLLILLDRGKNGPGPQDYSSDESEWPQNRPLEGIGASEHADHSQDWVVSGRVMDAPTGQPIKQFTVTPGNETLTWHRIRWDERDAADGTDGVYTVYVDRRWEQPVIKIEAAGYLPQSVTITPLEQTNADFALQKGDGPRGFVRRPDGRPVGSAEVLLLCPDAQNPSLNYDGQLQSGWPPQNGLLVKTGPDGHFSFEPRIGMQSVAAASPDGFAQVSIACLATNPNIVLEPYGSITGTLKRPNGPGANEELDLAFETPDSMGRLGLDNSAHTDSGGHFEFNRVPPGDLQLSYRVPVSQNGWQNAPLQPITVEPGQALKLEVKAAARQTGPRFGFGSPPAPPARIPGAPIAGTVVLPNGKPAPNAQVALSIRGQFLQLGKASLVSYDGWIVRADQNGMFSLPRYQGADTVIAVSEDGFAQVSVATLKQSPRIVLQPWARIEGVLRIGRRPGTNQMVVLSDWRPMTVSQSLPPFHLDLNAYQAKTDAQGRFVITYVPPGTHQLAREVPEGSGWTQETLGTIEFKPGATKRVTFGGNGRTVVGRLKVGDNAPKDWQDGALFLRTASPFANKIMEARSPEQRRKIIQSSEYQREMMNLRILPATLSADGSFKAEDVVPGKYELSLDLFKPGRLPPQPRTVTYLFSDAVLTVPKVDGSNDTPVDVGTVKLKTMTVPTFFPSKTNSTASK